MDITSERVRIHLNPNSGQNAFVIKCDLKEAIIDLNRLPIDKSGKKLNSEQIQALRSLPNLYDLNSCYDMELLGLISRSGLCDSVLFGIPYILSATRSTELQYKELEENFNRFYGLIKVMNEKKAVIVLRLKQQIDNNCLKTFFVLMSSPDEKTLIMKSIATKEMVLPYITDTVDTMVSRTPSQSVLDSVRNHLNGFPFTDIYNPLMIENNLFKFI